MRGIEVAALSLLVAGCAVLAPNNRELAAARSRLVAGATPAALAALEGRDDLPALLDRATILASIGDAESSNAVFDRALASIEARAYGPRLRVSAAAADAGSIVWNDTVRPWVADDFEWVLVHVLKALNHLRLGDHEGALVEMKRADRVESEAGRWADLGLPQDGDVDPAVLEARTEELFAPYRPLLARGDDPYANPLASWLSGVVYELAGDSDEALLDYRRAWSMSASPVVGRDLARVSERLGRTPEPGTPAPAAAAGNVLVVVEDGLAPEREQVTIPLPTPGAVVVAAVPMVRPLPSALARVEILSPAGDALGEAEPLADIEAMAVRSLHDRYPWILAREAARQALRAYGGYEATREIGVGGFLLTSAVNALSARADLRGWYALPGRIRAARVRVPPGTASLRLRLRDWHGAVLDEVDAPLAAACSGLAVASIRRLPHQTLVAKPPRKETC